MNTKTPLRTRVFTVLGIMAIVAIALLVPTPLHDWFVDSSIGGVPVRTAAFALLILFTPVTILATILRNFDVDYVDEVPADTLLPSRMHDVAMHAPM